MSSNSSSPFPPQSDGDVVTHEELQSALEGDACALVDVREPHEYQIVDIGAPLIPVGDLPNQLHRLTFPKTTEIVVHCKSGARSQRAALILKENGYTNVSNLSGGILAWADRIDKSLPKY